MDTAQSSNPRQSNPMVVCTVQLKMSMDASYPTSKTCPAGDASVNPQEKIPVILTMVWSGPVPIIWQVLLQPTLGL